MATSVQLIQGQDVTFVLQVLDQITQQPYPLNNILGATASFPNADGSALAVTGVIKSIDLGEFSVQLDEAQTAGLNAGEGQSIELAFDQTIDMAMTRSIVQYLEILNVVPRLFGS